MQHPRYFYSSNSVAKKVTRWLVGDGCLQFSLIPLQDVSAQPTPLFVTDRQYAYLNDALFSQMDVAFRGATSSSPLHGANVKPITHEWGGTIFKNFIKYKRTVLYTSQSANTIPGASGEQDTITQMVKQAERDLLSIEEGAKEAKFGGPSLLKAKETIRTVNDNAVRSNSTTDRNAKSGSKHSKNKQQPKGEAKPATQKSVTVDIEETIDPADTKAKKDFGK